MGWNSWIQFPHNVSESIIRQVADAMVTNGMRDAGYQYVNIDDYWAHPSRVNGHLQAFPATFPNGIKSLADYVHSKGLKLGLYSDRGRVTCGRCCAGSYGHEAADAGDFAAWGVDYLKYDNCNPEASSTPMKDFQRMRHALLATGRPIVFSICAWEFQDWMPATGELWRTSGDIKGDWENLMDIVDANERWAPFARPGGWNDPDMLVIGARALTESECRTQFSLWAIMAAPLIAGNDVRNIPRKIREILLNKEVIAVDQDPLGRQGIRVWDDGKGLNVYSKALQGSGVRAVALLNRTRSPAAITVKWCDIGLPAGSASVRDLWAHIDRGTFQDGYRCYVPPHGTVMIKITSATGKN
jgi:alpha-galactosidase